MLFETKINHVDFCCNECVNAKILILIHFHIIGNLLESHNIEYLKYLRVITDHAFFHVIFSGSWLLQYWSWRGPYILHNTTYIKTLKLSQQWKVSGSLCRTLHNSNLVQVTKIVVSRFQISSLTIFTIPWVSQFHTHLGKLMNLRLNSSKTHHFIFCSRLGQAFLHTYLDDSASFVQTLQCLEQFSNSY